MCKNIAGVTLAMAMIFALAAQAVAQAPVGAKSEMAQSGRIGPGTMIQVPSSDVPYSPTAAQNAIHEQLMALKSKHVAPPIGPHTTAADVARAAGPATVPAPAAGTFTVFASSLINSGGSQSTVNEPSAANGGKTVVETSNWNIAYSTNGGAVPIVWANQNPYALSSGYCCDTQVVYSADRDVFVLLLLDYAGEGAATNGLTISLARSGTPTSWCTYKFNGANFGQGATDTLDFAKIALSNNDLYITWNDYPPNSGFSASGLARLPLDPMSNCQGVGYSYLNRNTEFTFALSQGSSHDTFYWVSNWFGDGTVDGQNLRIFQWAENSGSYSWNTVAINAFTFGNAACGSPNWCSRLDPRYEAVVISPAEFRGQANSAFAGDDILEVANSAGPSSFSNGFNYVVYNYFKLHSLSYIGSDQTYSTGTNFAYPSCAVNEKGYVGCAMAYGTNAPGGLIVLQDNVSPNQPWAYSFWVGADGGASAWGDYTVTNPWRPSGGPFQTVLWNVNSGTGAVQPFYIVWGRGSDGKDYNHWKSR